MQQKRVNLTKRTIMHNVTHVPDD